MSKSRIALALFCTAALLPTTAFAIYNGTLETGCSAVGAVLITYSGGGGQVMGTGTLVGDSWVATTAHGYQAGCTAVFLLGAGASASRTACCGFPWGSSMPTTWSRTSSRR